ncbi:hypothetical protein MPH_12695 [Macrophomina phaseolina MS6]|uniref:Uncharacterized protein n=1 Tax=Macrophomina phaseolina (strain MS6) TaxID=1126212 RepID=K2S0J4_MACPH|nr:hypothetical protein MPH_12695 [Macrophomina phaseolina MS6]
MSFVSDEARLRYGPTSIDSPSNSDSEDSPSLWLTLLMKSFPGLSCERLGGMLVRKKERMPFFTSIFGSNRANILALLKAYSLILVLSRAQKDGRRLNLIWCKNISYGDPRHRVIIQNVAWLHFSLEGMRIKKSVSRSWWIISRAKPLHPSGPTNCRGSTTEIHQSALYLSF